MPQEIIRFLKTGIVYFTCVVFQVKGDGVHPLGLDEPPGAVDFYIVSLI